MRQLAKEIRTETEERQASDDEASWQGLVDEADERVRGRRRRQAIEDLGTAVRALTTPPSHPAVHPMAGWDDRAYGVAHSPATLIEPSRREHQALWPAIAAVIEAPLRWAGPVILE